jgi:hypothetical protein
MNLQNSVVLFPNAALTHILPTQRRMGIGERQSSSQMPLIRPYQPRLLLDPIKSPPRIHETGSSVLVQSEMEKKRFPLVKIPPL